MADNITFDTIPQDILTGGVFIEIDPSQAVTGLPQQERKLLLLGQKLTAGVTPILTPVRVLNASDAIRQFGQGSMLHKMAQSMDAVKELYGLVDVYAVAMDDLPVGTLATGTIELSGVVSKAGVLKCYLGGELVQSQASLNDTAAEVATKLAQAINANADLPVTAEATEGKVKVSARHKGEAYNGFELATTFYDEDFLPEGLNAICTNMKDGAGNPDVADALAMITDNWFYTIVCPYADSANLAAIEADMEGRWGGMNMKAGHIFTAKSGTHAQLTTWGDTRNSPHGTTWGLKGCPTWDPVRLTAFAGVCEYRGAIDPALPLRDLVVPNTLAPRPRDRFSRNERELLLRDGISSTTVDAGGRVIIERVITNYQVNSQGILDRSLLRLETKWTVDYVRYALRVGIALRWPRHKLVDNGTNIAPGQKYVTADMIKAEIVSIARELELAGIIENVDDLKKKIIVVRSMTDVDRVNAIIPPDLVNQFVTFAAAVQFKL